MRLLALYILVLIFTGCGADAEQEREDAILSGQIFLDKLRCQEAIDVLEEAGRDTKNILYMKTLATAYACKAGYNTPNFFTNDIPKIASSGNIIGGFTNFSNASSNNAPDNDSFENMQTAIDLLLYAGGLDTTKDPTIARRSAAMEEEEANEINTLLLFMVLDQMGRYFYHYGDASGGKKAARNVGGNECLANYNGTYRTTNEIVIGATTIGANTLFSDLIKSLGNAAALNVSGECGDGVNNDAANDTLEDEGHPDFGVKDSLNKARLCQGVVLWNNFRKLVVEVISKVSSSDLGELINISAILNTQIGYLESAVPLSKTYVTETLSQSKCVTDNTNYGTTEQLEWYFAFIFEALFDS